MNIHCCRFAFDQNSVQPHIANDWIDSKWMSNPNKSFIFQVFSFVNPITILDSYCTDRNACTQFQFWTNRYWSNPTAWQMAHRIKSCQFFLSFAIWMQFRYSLIDEILIEPQNSKTIFDWSVIWAFEWLQIEFCICFRILVEYLERYATARNLLWWPSTFHRRSVVNYIRCYSPWPRSRFTVIRHSSDVGNTNAMQTRHFHGMFVEPPQTRQLY